MALRINPRVNNENATELENVKAKQFGGQKLTRPALGEVKNRLAKKTTQPTKILPCANKPEPVEKFGVFHKDDVRVTRSKSTRNQDKSPIPMECETDALIEAFSSKLLPPSVRDVDVEDCDNPQLVHEYAKDIFDYLKVVENQFPIKEDFLCEQKEINSRMRAILVDWLVQVHQRFSLLQETLFLTVSIMDRFLQAQQVSKSHLQLVGVASMYLAGKYEEMYPAEVNDFVYITDNAYTKKEIFKMEMAILKGLTFDLNRPLPIHFLRRYSKVGNCDAMVHQLAKYIMELSMTEYSLSHFSPSQIAAAALYLSLQLLEEGEGAIWNETLIYYSGYNADTLMELSKKLATLLSKAETAKLQAIRSKYSQSKFGKISLHPAIKSATLANFVN